MSMGEDIDDLPPGGGDTALAAEHVLRLLDPAEAAACEAREAAEPAFAAEVARWRTDFAELDAAYAPVTPSAALRARVMERLFPEAPGASALARLWGSVALWRGLAAGAAAAAVAVWFAVAPAPDTGLLAAMGPREGAGEFVASFEPATGTITVTRLAGDLDAGAQDFQLWALVDQAPVSLGLLPDAPRAEIVLPPELAARIGNGTLVEVSREPEGGSPLPGPSGDVMAAGFLRDI